MMKLFDNGDLLVPKRAETEDDSMYGDGMVRITLHDPDYIEWLNWYHQLQHAEANNASNGQDT